MILQVTREDLSSDTMQAVLSIHDTLSCLPLDERLVVAAEYVLVVLREQRLLAQTEPTRRKSYGALCGDVQAWLRREIETLRFEKSR